MMALDASSERELDQVFPKLPRLGADALMVHVDAVALRGV
jgi:hypothetical protein